MKFLKLKIIISVYLCLIILALYNSFHVYSSNKVSAKQNMFAKLSTIANILAAQIDGDEHQELTTHRSSSYSDSIPNDVNYAKIHQQLKKVQKSSNINTPIYTLIKSDVNNKYLFAVTSNEEPYYLHSYHTPPQKLINDFEKGGDVDEYKDENGVWLSSFAPIKNKAGKVVAIVQIDKNFEEFLADINNKLFNNIIFILLVYSVIGFFLFLFLKDILHKEESHNRIQKSYKYELEREVKERTVELNEVNLQLSKSNKELESFFYSTSHDIRGPLCRILGLTSLAKIEDDNGEIVEMIEIESQKMDDMLKKMVLVNNIRTKELEIKEIAVNVKINEAVKDAVQRYKFTKAEAKVSVTIQCLKKFNTDEEILHSIIHNTIDNAFKFCDSAFPVIKISAVVDKDSILTLNIQNNGKRFSEVELKNAFDFFKRAHKQGDTDTIRLGLYTIKTCTDKLNGVVDISFKNGLTNLKVLIPDYHVHKKPINIYNQEIG